MAQWQSVRVLTDCYAICTQATADSGVDWPGWIEAIATVVAALAAIVAGLYARRAVSDTGAALALERERDEQRAEEARRQQASMVSAWIERDDLVIIRNLSYQPISHIELHILFGGNFSQVNADLGVIGGHPSDPELSDRKVPIPDAYMERYLAEEDDGPFGATLVFRDAAGRDWVRRPDGDLRDGRDVILAGDLQPAALAGGVTPE